MGPRGVLTPLEQGVPEYLKTVEIATPKPYTCPLC